MRVAVLNGVNLGRLGSREPLIYGSTTHTELAQTCVDTGAELPEVPNQVWEARAKQLEELRRDFVLDWRSLQREKAAQLLGRIGAVAVDLLERRLQGLVLVLLLPAFRAGEFFAFLDEPLEHHAAAGG